MRTRFGILLSLAVAMSACSAGSGEWTPLPSGAEPPGACARADADQVIAVSADQLRFNVPCLVAQAGEAFVVRFTNNESEPHNVAIFADRTTATKLLDGEIFNGPDVTREYSAEALPAGEYYFNCIVHPTGMNGALYVR